MLEGLLRSLGYQQVTVTYTAPDRCPTAPTTDATPAPAGPTRRAPASRRRPVAKLRRLCRPGRGDGVIVARSVAGGRA